MPVIVGGAVGKVYSQVYKPRTNANRAILEEKRRQNSRARELQNNNKNNTNIKCELYWFNGLTTYTTAVNRGRVKTEDYPGMRLKFRSAHMGTVRRVLQRLTRANYLTKRWDPQSYIEKTYKEIKRSVLNRVQVVIAGHSHGGLITTLMAEKLNSDPEVPSEKLNNLYIVTFNTIRIIDPSIIPRISHLYQIVNTNDIAQIPSGYLRPILSTFRAHPVSQTNGMLWNGNLNIKHDKSTTHTFLNRKTKLLWLWRKIDEKNALTFKNKLVNVTKKACPTILGAAVAGPVGAAACAAATIAASKALAAVESHKNYNLDNFVTSVKNMFRETIKKNSAINKLRANMLKMTRNQLIAARNNAPYGSNLRQIYQNYKNLKGW